MYSVANTGSPDSRDEGNAGVPARRIRHPEVHAMKLTCPLRRGLKAAWGPVSVIALAVASAANGGEIVNFLPPGANCPGGEGTEDIAGCQIKDKKLFTSETDANKVCFEVWCLDKASFGLRYVKKNADDTVADERWVGLCGYSGGKNVAGGMKEPVAGGGFTWVKTVWESTDNGPPPPSKDDDADGKKDAIKFLFFVAGCKLEGTHKSDGVVDSTQNWDCAPGGDPDIPGDPNTTTDGPTDLTQLLPAGGPNDPSPLGGGNGECPVGLDQETVPNTSDCDGDGESDPLQIAFGDASDVNNNGVPDSCECVGDLNGDGMIDGADLGLLIWQWRSGAGTGSSGDLDGSGSLDEEDVKILLDSWGPCP